MNPLVPGDLDLRNLAFMPLDVGRLRDSDIARQESGEAFRAAVLLWCAAWHQVPASSLPNDDILLASFAGFGRDLKGWRKIKVGALHGFVECSDGRLYHSVIAEKAIEADAKRNAYRNRTKSATEARWKRGGIRNGHYDGGTTDCNTDVSVSVRDKEREDKTADAASSAEKYAFEGKIIKLNHKHFGDWSKAYSHLDLLGELIARDAWLASDRATDADRKNWFISTSKYLANRNQEAKNAQAKSNFKWNGIEGVI